MFFCRKARRQRLSGCQGSGTGSLKTIGRRQPEM